MKTFLLFFAWAQDEATNDYLRSLTPIENVGDKEAGNNFTALWTLEGDRTTPVAYAMTQQFDNSEIDDLCAENPYWVCRPHDPENGNVGHDLFLFGQSLDPQLFPYDEG